MRHPLTVITPVCTRDNGAGLVHGCCAGLAGLPAGLPAPGAAAVHATGLPA